MPLSFDHKVLIVDDEEMIGHALARLIKDTGAESVYMTSGTAALEAVKKADSPFSLILSDQQMPGMKGSELLEKVREISPDTIRFLITGYTDMDAVIDAVNKGAIHKYISKPWDNRILIETIKTGISLHEAIMENHRLFALAKEQTIKLYNLNLDLKKAAEAHEKTIVEKDEQIARLNDSLKKGAENIDHINEIETILRKNEMLDQQKLDVLYADIVAVVYGHFQDIAAMSGFEMPDDSQDMH